MKVLRHIKKTSSRCLFLNYSGISSRTWKCMYICVDWILGNGHCYSAWLWRLFEDKFLNGVISHTQKNGILFVHTLLITFTREKLVPHRNKVLVQCVSVLAKWLHHADVWTIHPKTLVSTIKGIFSPKLCFASNFYNIILFFPLLKRETCRVRIA